MESQKTKKSRKKRSHDKIDEKTVIKSNKRVKKNDSTKLSKEVDLVSSAASAANSGGDSAVDDTEQWAKYMKVNKTLTGDKKTKKSRIAPTTTTSTTTTTTKTPKPSKKVKTDPLEKPREPCDLMRNEKKQEELKKNTVQSGEQIDASNATQKALAVNLLPPRVDQNVETLALTEIPRTYHGEDIAMSIKRMNYINTMNTSSKMIRPLQDLLGDQGFLPINNQHEEHVLKCVMKGLRNDINFSNYLKVEEKQQQQQQNNTLGLDDQKGTIPCSTLATTTTPRTTGAKKKKGDGNIVNDVSNKKLNHIFGNVFHSFGYLRRTPQNQEKSTKIEHEIDIKERYKQFYKNDELEDGENETNYGQIPTTYRMFRELRRLNTQKYLRRDESLRDTATLTPKTDLEEISKEYIMEFRQPPRTTDKLCANGESCVFNTFSPDKSARYIGRVFYTERERLARLKEESSSGGGGGREKEYNEHSEFEQHGLCYDCLLRKWTITWVMNIQNEIVAERPINYFSVMCKPGQYSPHCMLSQVENHKMTGIIGFVPRFSLNNRRIVVHQRTIKRDGGKLELLSVPVLVETGMDF